MDSRTKGLPGPRPEGTAGGLGDGALQDAERWHAAAVGVVGRQDVARANGEVERHGLALEEIGRRGWSLLAEDLPLPVAVLRQQALTNNSRWMREFVARTGTKLAPHGKTTMSPQLFVMQMADGAWGLTLATIQQVRVARAAGINRILLANEIVGRSDIAYVLDELQGNPSFDFYCLVDSLDGARRLIDAARARAIGRPLNLLIEIGYQGGRAGCRDIDTAVAVARAAKAAEPHVALRGVEGFEGLHQSLPAAEGEQRVREFLQRIVSTAERIDAEGLFADFAGDEIILSAGGSAFYDLVVDVFAGAQVRNPARLGVVLRSGCYLTHDAGLYERSFNDVKLRSEIAQHIPGKFENALEVWAYVLSVPESRRAILGAGRRDFGHESGMPTPIKHFRPGRDARPVALTGPVGAGWEIAAVNDQHAHVVLPAAGADVRVGDLVALGVSHPCTTFDKWKLLYVVDDDYRVCSAIETFF
jgi:D-serine dehydratase